MADAQTDGSRGPVVVGVDGSAEARDAIALGDRLASALESTVLLTFVHPFERAAKKMPSPEYDQLVKEVANATLEGLPVEGPGSKPRQMRVVGGSSPGNGLHSLAAAEQATLVVVGSSNRGGLGRVTPGGVGEPLLAGSPCPVAVAPRGYATDPPPMSVVGVAYDAGSESKMALQWAVRIAERLKAELRLIAVHSRMAFGNLPVGGPGQLSSVNAALHEEMRKDLESAAEKISDLDVTQHLHDGDAASELVRESAELGLLVTGSRGYGPVRTVLLGSVANDVIRGSKCPVVVVPRGAT
jgi:nucleotide-binding universal stress UspA family protein